MFSPKSPRSPITAFSKRSEHLTLTILVYGYAVFLGAAYLFAFWRPFGLSVFPYLSLQDYISSPLNRVIVLIAVPLLSLPLVLERLQVSYEAFKIVAIGLIIGYSSLSLWYLADSLRLYVQHSFHYRNETTVLMIAVILVLTSWGVAFNARRSVRTLPNLLLALGIIQSSTVVLAGYKDGKTIYNGAVEVHFLDTRELCEKGGQQQWVLLGRFSEVSIFLNTTDKRLCITGEKSYRLSPREVIGKTGNNA